MRQRSESPGHLPDVVGIGAMKAGTTSLNFYLGRHPQIAMCVQKEPSFFIQEGWSRGLPWYRQQFPGRALVYGEVSPVYTAFPLFPGVPHRMKQVVPGAKLIYLVRDPIERMVSEYVHWYADGREDRPVDKALGGFGQPGHRYVCRSRYWWQLQQYLEHFPAERILVLDQADLRRRPRETMAEVFRFVGVSPDFTTWMFRLPLHMSVLKRRRTAVGSWLERNAIASPLCRLPQGLRNNVEKVLYWPLSRAVRRPAVDPVLEAELRHYLASDIEQLEAFVGRPFADWGSGPTRTAHAVTGDSRWQELLRWGRRAAISGYRRLPVNPGQSALRRVDRWLCGLRSDQPQIVERDGIRYEVDNSQLFDNAVYWEGAWEASTRGALRRLARPGMTILDVGANVGCHTLDLSRCVGRSGQVIAFEPTVWAVAKLRRNLSLNSWTHNVRVERLALSDEDQPGKAYCFRAQWHHRHGPMEPERGVVDRLKLDTYCQRAGVQRVNLIKIDVDGFEAKVLRGAQALLERGPPALVVEMGDQWQRLYGESLESLLAQLTPWGYCFVGEQDFEPIDVSTATSAAPNGALNVVCLPPGQCLPVL